MFLTLLMTLYLSVAQAVTYLTSSQIQGDWSDIGCATAYISFLPGGRYEYRVWDGERYALETTMYWWMQEGMVVFGTSMGSGVIAVLAVEEISSKGLIGAYAMIDGTTKGVLMVKCL